jgi:pimeloyl-ACP methyl ester carboxylesterase
VYVPDLAGFGLSSKPACVLNVGEHAELVSALLDTLGTAPVALLGNSFGCQVAVELVLRRPGIVAALILVGPTTDPAAATAWGQAGRLPAHDSAGWGADGGCRPGRRLARGGRVSPGAN